MAEVGRPSVLDEDLKLKIRALTLEGKGNNEVAEIIGVPIETYDHWIWRNYQGFADCLTTYRHERMMKKAETVIERSMDSDDEKVAADSAKFTAETLGKRWFSKRSELTGAEGKPLIVVGEVADKHQLGEQGN